MSARSCWKNFVAAALLSAPAALVAAVPAARAQSPASGAAPPSGVRIEARFVDRVSGLEAGWGATGQIQLPPSPGDAALQRWRDARTVAVSSSRQSLTLEPGGRGLVRVGREIPFAGWLLRHGVRCGLVEEDTSWREVESALEVELESPASPADGSVRIAVTPEFNYLQGRTRRSVAFGGERVEILLPLGAETRFVPPAAREPLYSRLLAGYDPLRRVGEVELVLRAEPAGIPEP
jgi:hypothetical protein